MQNGISQMGCRSFINQNFLFERNMGAPAALVLLDYLMREWQFVPLSSRMHFNFGENHHFVIQANLTHS
jgi:hypothetical protein